LARAWAGVRPSPGRRRGQGGGIGLAVGQSRSHQ
jgi:hypothetical protein